MVYNDLFHVHTYRCRHAGKYTDIDYINEALNLNAKSIYFTDHAPFPKDVFKNRMRIEELNEYINSLLSLKKQYNDRIKINIGLEIEYLPEYISYYKWLKDKYNIQLFLGQHICYFKGHYNFEYENKKEEYKWMTNSIIEAIDTGLFDVLLHPERIYKNCDIWNEQQITSANEIWKVTQNNNIPVEYNYSSIVNKNIKYWHSKFWEKKIHNNIIYGIDAHGIKELYDGTNFFRIKN